MAKTIHLSIGGFMKRKLIAYNDPMTIKGQKWREKEKFYENCVAAVAGVLAAFLIVLGLCFMI